MDIKKLFSLKLTSRSVSAGDIKSAVGKLRDGWFRRYRIFFVVLFIIAIIGGGYIWYASLYKSQWSGEKKQQYIDLQKKEVGFKEEDFIKVVEKIKNRKANYEKDPELVKEIFRAPE